MSLGTNRRHILLYNAACAVGRLDDRAGFDPTEPSRAARSRRTWFGPARGPLGRAGRPRRSALTVTPVRQTRRSSIKKWSA